MTLIQAAHRVLNSAIAANASGQQTQTSSLGRRTTGVTHRYHSPLTTSTTMTSTSRLLRPNVDELPTELVHLQAVLNDLPASELARVEPLLDKVIDSTKRRRRILAMVQEALSQLRLDLKYLMFDLEATRRERDQYRRELEGHA